ncbi:MAG: hypothetical protein M0Q12_00115 [Synergistaceae bacterium]|jgi:hypothetical protein|nr:hypothetical protein [Synergistaceae bacterium]
MATTKTTDKDKGYGRIVRDLPKLKSAAIFTGYFTPEIAFIAACNEFGTSSGGSSRSGGQIIHSPERSFLRTSFDENKEQYHRKAARLFGYMLDGKFTPNGVLMTLGQITSNDVKKKITAIRIPANAPSTIKAKGFDNPLIWSGRMRNETNFKVVM